jgi:hypothetical protein
MRYHVAEFTDQGLKSITISHGEDAMTWDARPYARASRIDGNKAVVDPANDLVFREINAFIATLSAERQQVMWETYSEIWALFEQNYDPMALKGRLQKAIKRIYDQVPYQELHEWATMSSMIQLPQNLKTHYGENDPEDLTYLRQDYFDLTVLAIAARPMVPIWGEYIPRIKDQIETTFKEYEAVKLLYQTYITSCVPYQRMHRYMEASIGNKSKLGNMFSALISGLASSDMPDWLLANTLVRRTSVVPIASSNDGPNIVTDVYQYVNNTLRSPGHRRFAGPYAEKTVRKDEKSDQQESMAESYKIKQELSDGEVVMANIYMQQAHAIALAIDPTIDLEKLNWCVEAIGAMEVQPILKHQLTLTQWVLYSVISTKYVPLLSKTALLSGMAVTQALLWHWGYFDLAGLLTTREVKQDNEEFVSAQETRAKIPKEIMDEMVVVFPNPYPVKGKNVTPRQSNPGCRSVDVFYNLIANSDWFMFGPRQLVALTNRQPASRKMYVPADIRIQLARLLLHLYTKRLEFDARSKLAAFPVRTAIAN